MKGLSQYPSFLSLSSTALIATGFLAGAAQASEQICFSDSIPLQTTNWNSTVSVSKFDPSLGILTGIYFELSGDISGSAAIESLDAQPSTVTTTFQADITLTRPDLSVLVVATPLEAFVDNLTAFDGVVDFAGTSGITHSAIQTNDTVSTNSPPPASDLVLFTGAPGNPGTIVLPIDAAGSSSATGSGNLITQFLTDAGADVMVCYTYELDCNGNGIPDSTDISSGTSPDLDGDGIPDECQPGTWSFCEGDGSANGGADCPCNNNGQPGEGCDNGTGSGGLLTASGVPSVSQDTLQLCATQIPATAPGYFFYSTSFLNGGDGIPFDSGLRCLGGIVRVKKFNSGGGCIPQTGAPPIHIQLGFAAGSTNYFQYWYRNPNGPCVGGNANTTNAVRVVWGL